MLYLSMCILCCVENNTLLHWYVMYNKAYPILIAWAAFSSRLVIAQRCSAFPQRFDRMLRLPPLV